MIREYKKARRKKTARERWLKARRLMGIGILLFCLLTAVIPDMQVHAEDDEDSWEISTRYYFDENYHMNFSSGDRSGESKGIKQYSSWGSHFASCFCLEPFMKVKEKGRISVYYTPEEAYAIYDWEKQLVEQFVRASFFGYTLSPQTDNDYFATQYAIWKLICDHVWTHADPEMNKFYEECCQNIAKCSDLWDTQPSFSEQVFELPHLPESLTLHDDTGAFSFYMRIRESIAQDNFKENVEGVTKDGVHYTWSGDDLKLSVDDSFPADQEVLFEIPGLSRQGAFCLKREESQLIMEAANSIDHPAIQFRVKAQKNGSLVVKKTGEKLCGFRAVETAINEPLYEPIWENRPLKEVEFILKSLITGQVLESGSTDEKGELQFTDIPSGTYLLMEQKTPEGYVPAAAQEVMIKPGEQNEIALNNRQQIKDLSAVKAFYCGGLPEQKAEELNQSCLFALRNAEEISYEGGVLPAGSLLGLQNPIVDPSLPQTIWQAGEGNQPGSKLNSETPEVGAEENKRPEQIIRSRLIFSLPALASYTLEELSCPPNFAPAGKLSYDLSQASDGSLDQDGDLHFLLKEEISNKASLSRLTVTKQGVWPQGHESPLAGVRYALFRNLDGKAGERLAEALTNEEGMAHFENLPLGNYLVQEEKAPEGWLVDPVAKEFEVKAINSDMAMHLKDDHEPLEPPVISFQPSVSLQQETIPQQIQAKRLAVTRLPATGETRPVFWQLLLGLSLAAGLFLIRRKR